MIAQIIIGVSERDFAVGIEPSRVHRRTLLSGAVTLVTAVAGCLGSPPNSAPPTDESPPTRSPAATSTPGTEPRPVVRDITLHTIDGQCGESAGADITQTADGIRATGRLVAATPCHDAALLDFNDAGATARIHVGVHEPPNTPDCAQCIAEIHFELTAVFDGAFDAVVLDLEGRNPTTVRKELT